MKKIFSFGLILLILAGGCKKESHSQLLATTWVLYYIQDTKTNAITYFPSDAGGKISIVFSGSSDVITFSGICNSGTGNYVVPSSGNIMITPIALTKINCVDVEWEGYTALSLSSAYGYNAGADNLVIYSNGSYNLYFTKQ